MKQFHYIITETINQYLLQEALTDVVYHFTNPYSLLKVCQTNTLLMSEAITRSADTMHKRKLFYLSTTRQFNGTQGYSRGRKVRIELDGAKLNERFEGKAINYWEAHSSNEFEDRLFSDEPYISDANKYIKHVSMLVEGRHPNEYVVAYHCLLCASKFGIKISIFDNEKDFNNPRSTNTINHEIMKQTELHGVNPYRIQHVNEVYTALEKVIDFCATFEEIQYDNLAQYVSNLLKKYNLSPHINHVIKYVQKQAYSWRYGLPHIQLDDLRGSNEYIVILQLLRDVLQKYGLRNVIEAERIWQHRGRTKNTESSSHFDTEKTINILCYCEGFKKIPILNPDTTPFWSIFDKGEVNYYKSNFVERLTYHDSEYGIRSHKSKNDEYFDKYVQHLVKSNKITVTQMLDILNRVDYYDDIISDIFYGKFMNIEIDYYNCWKVARNEQEEKQIKELFRK